jgi:hypothetical protein
MQWLSSTVPETGLYGDKYADAWRNEDLLEHLGKLARPHSLHQLAVAVGEMETTLYT